MDAVKRKLHGVRVLLHGIASLLRTARPTMDAVEESYPAVEETSHAAAACAHGAWRRAKCWQTGCMSRSRRGDWGRSESAKYVVEHVRRYLQAFFLQEPYLLLTFAVRGQKS